MNSKEKIAFVCQRYGIEVNGGSELYCMQTAEHLSEYYDVTVYTTCALDYVTWKNYYPAGEEMLRGVRVKRWQVTREREQERFDRISRDVYSNPNHTDQEEIRWIEEQGPICREVIQALQEEHTQYRVVFFMTYLYYLSATGLPRRFENAVLIPTLHDEPPVYLRAYDKVFESAKALLWLTPEEREFAYIRFPFIRNKRQMLIGAGIDEPAEALPEIPQELKGSQYLVYAGRIDESKGCAEMFDFFLKMKKDQNSELKLVLMGKPVMKIPEHPDIIRLGFVSEEMKLAVMKEAFALLLFSHFESLSMVVLESMMMGRPVLVSEKCAVLKGHCIRSGAGLYFNSYPEFAGCVNWLERHPDEYQIMRESGKRYVKENYTWKVIIGKYRELTAEFRNGR